MIIHLYSMRKQKLYNQNQIESLPKDLKQEVKAFAGFLLEIAKYNHVPKKERIAGLAKGMIKMRSDFEGPGRFQRIY